MIAASLEMSDDPLILHLQLADVLADGRLTDEQFASRLRKTQVLRHSVKNFQPEIHTYKDLQLFIGCRQSKLFFPEKPTPNRQKNIFSKKYRVCLHRKKIIPYFALAKRK